MPRNPSVPTLTQREVFHVGRLDQRLDSASHEGCLLSVSRHPEVWRVIACLGDAPVWTLSRPARQLRLADFRAARADAALTEMLVASGLLRRLSGWELPLGGGQVMMFADKQSALREAPTQYAAARVRPAVRWGASPEVEKYWHAGRNREPIHPLAAFDAALACHIETRLNPKLPPAERFDGIWWPQKFSPANLSAPRGGLFRSTLPELSVTNSAGERRELARQRRLPNLKFPPTTSPGGRNPQVR